MKLTASSYQNRFLPKNGSICGLSPAYTPIFWSINWCAQRFHLRWSVYFYRGMLVIIPRLVHAVVHGAVSRFQHQAHALVHTVVGARADRIQERHGSFDLLQDGDRVG